MRQPYGVDVPRLLRLHAARRPARGALGLPVVWVCTHDSVGVGEDGPTHQPVEQLAALRAIPNLTVHPPRRRQRDRGRVAASRSSGRTGRSALVLTRQKLPVLDRAGVARPTGVGAAPTCSGERERRRRPTLILHRHRLRGARWRSRRRELLGAEGVAARVVSMPCWELFDGAGRDYRDEVLPPARERAARVEAGITLGWQRWVGDAGRRVGIDHFGASAPGEGCLQRVRLHRRQRRRSGRARSLKSSRSDRRAPEAPRGGRLNRSTTSTKQGQSLWLDNVRRDSDRAAGSSSWVDGGVRGVTSNPTIFQKAISQGSAYDEQLRGARRARAGREGDLHRARGARHRRGLRPDAEGLGRAARACDGYVSLEVDPTLAYDTDGTLAEARRLHALVDRPNLYVKIPGTKPGLPAIEEMIADGKSINVTLIFSLERYREVMEAYIRGLERLVGAGGDPRPVSSVASFFVSRVDTEADKRLDAIGGHDELKGGLAVANAKLAYQSWLEVFAGERWEALAGEGRLEAGCLWASTSTKNPAYRDVLYVEDLIGPDTVNTMPEETIERVPGPRRGCARRSSEDLDGARRLLEQLAAAGVDVDDVTRALEDEGVQKFADSFDELLERDPREARRAVELADATSD